MLDINIFPSLGWLVSIGTFLCASLTSGCAALAPGSLSFALLPSVSSDSFPPALMRGGGREEGWREGGREGGRREGRERRGAGRKSEYEYKEPNRGKPTFSLVAIIGGLLSSQPFSKSPAAPVATQV